MPHEELGASAQGFTFPRQTFISLLVFAIVWQGLSYLAPFLGIPPFAIPSLVRIAIAAGAQHSSRGPGEVQGASQRGGFGDKDEGAGGDRETKVSGVLHAFVRAAAAAVSKPARPRRNPATSTRGKRKEQVHAEK